MISLTSSIKFFILLFSIIQNNWYIEYFQLKLCFQLANFCVLSQRVVRTISFIDIISSKLLNFALLRFSLSYFSVLCADGCLVSSISIKIYLTVIFRINVMANDCFCLSIILNWYSRRKASDAEMYCTY